MHQHLALLAAPLVLCLMCAGCGDSLSRGMIITGDGKVGANNARNQRSNAQDTLRTAIEDDLGPGWTVQVEIPELPVWIEDRIGDDGTWRWERASVAISVTPPACATLTDAKRDELDAGARAYLLGKLVRKQPELIAVTVSAGASAPASVPTPADPAAPRSYIAQAGDTWADLSQAFYGTPQHWRLIQDANGGALVAGQPVVIPPRPAP
jgi:nucleoid-associated protein YgaU